VLHLPTAARSFSTIEARRQDLLRFALDVPIFHPRVCELFELGIDRAPEVELLCAPSAFELFFPGDGCANIFVAFKLEQALAAIGRSETFPCALLMLHDTEIQVAGNANVKRACMAAENGDVGARHSKMPASSWFSAAGKTVPGPVVEKLRAAVGK
jgi:hypothetical protein